MWWKLGGDRLVDAGGEPDRNQWPHASLCPFLQVRTRRLEELGRFAPKSHIQQVAEAAFEPRPMWPKILLGPHSSCNSWEAVGTSASATEEQVQAQHLTGQTGPFGLSAGHGSPILRHNQHRYSISRLLGPWSWSSTASTFGAPSHGHRERATVQTCDNCEEEELRARATGGGGGGCRAVLSRVGRRRRGREMRRTLANGSQPWPVTVHRETVKENVSKAQRKTTAM